MLRDRTWQLRYTPDDGDLVRLFYIPALQDARRYHRLTGYFNAGALALAARGIEGLVRNNGHMRLLVGCTLEADEIAAIERGEALREQVVRRMEQLPLNPPDAEARGALELLAWMIGRGHLDVKVAVPCSSGRVPVPDGAIFHEKAGIVEDGAGSRIAWNGSLNETAAGWQRNWESVHVYTSWGPEPERVESEEASFARLWANRSPRLIVLDVPTAVREDLLRFLPKDDLPKRLQPQDVREGPQVAPKRTVAPLPPVDLRARVWRFIEQAPRLPEGGAQVGAATAAVEPWPHQARTFQRLYAHWPPKLLIADEVGLGKTIQAGLLLRQAWLAGKAKRVLVLAPKAVLGQWQIELREKFNLDWPIYDGRKLVWFPSAVRQAIGEPTSNDSAWHEQPAVIASSQLMRRGERAKVLLEEAEPWDLIVLDEAHHARRRSSGVKQDDRPNALLRLMRELKNRTQGLLLLTATPMQVHPIETWDLLALLGLPAEWTESAFLQFFEDLEHPNPSARSAGTAGASVPQRRTRLRRSVERERATHCRPLAAANAQAAERPARPIDHSAPPVAGERTRSGTGADAFANAHPPSGVALHAATAAPLRQGRTAGFPHRRARRGGSLPADDRRGTSLYEAVETYIASAYDQAGAAERNAVGFVMTVYRRRVASSFQALRHTFERRLAAMDERDAVLLSEAEEDAPDDETAEALDADELERLAHAALRADERAQINVLLERASALPPDSKLASLKTVLAELRAGGYEQAMVFTQFTDTMDFLRDALQHAPAPA